MTTKISEILQNISFDWTKILRSISVYDTHEKVTTVFSSDMSWGLAPEYPTCQTIDISKYFDFHKAAPRQIYFKFFRARYLGIELHIGDKGKALRRPLKERP